MTSQLWVFLSFGGLPNPFRCSVIFFFGVGGMNYVRYSISIAFIRNLEYMSFFIGAYTPVWLFSLCLRRNMPFDVLSLLLMDFLKFW